MGRLLFWLLLAGGCCWAYFGWFDSPAAVQPVDAAGLEVGRAPVQAAESVAARPAGADEPLAAAPLHAAAQDVGEPWSGWTAGARRGEPVAVAAILGRLAAGEAAPAPAIEALHGATANAAAKNDARALLAMLGTNNAFLHSAEGRDLALRTVAAAGAAGAEEASLLLTQLVETCMRGPLAKTDAEAQACLDKVYAALTTNVRQLVLNPAHIAKARTYEVKAGDSLDRIAARFRRENLAVESGTLALVNRITDPRRLRAGQVLKVPVEPIRTVIEKHSFLMAVYVGDVIVRLYRIGHGKDGNTPETTFTIGAKQEKPDWYADGRVVPYGHPDNVLGDYFVKFEHKSYQGFGAHGTSEPDTIGTMASAGCIRMHDADIEEFFRIIPRGTLVEVRGSR